eukprot:SAG22_NODE_499_length_9725_cov_2.325784_9_plen_478_part_00
MPGEVSEVDQYETFSWHTDEKAVARRVKEQKNAHDVEKNSSVDDKDLFQDELIKEIEAHENLKGAGTVHGGHHNQFEWCLVCEHSRIQNGSLPGPEAKSMIDALEAAGLELHHYASVTGTEYYIKVSSHDKQLMLMAEQMELQCRLVPHQAKDNTGRVINDGGPVWFGGMAENQMALHDHFVPATQLHLYMRIPFPKARRVGGAKSKESRPHIPPIPESQGGPSFFTSGERQQIIRHIIEAPTGEGGCDISLDSAIEANHIRQLEGDHWEEYLLTKAAENKKRAAQAKLAKAEKRRERFQAKREKAQGREALALIKREEEEEEAEDEHDAEDEIDENLDQMWTACLKAFFPLHDDDELFDMNLVWARLELVYIYPARAVFKGLTLRPWGIALEMKKLTEQPLQDIRNYFGEQIALYFAFMGVYTQALFWPALTAGVDGRAGLHRAGDVRRGQKPAGAAVLDRHHALVGADHLEVVPA